MTALDKENPSLLALFIEIFAASGLDLTIIIHGDVAWSSAIVLPLPNDFYNLTGQIQNIGEFVYISRPAMAISITQVIT